MVISKNYKDTEKILKENKYNHLRIMVDFLKSKNKPNILELGVERGASTTAFCIIAEEIDGKVYSVDINNCNDAVTSNNWRFIQSNDLNHNFILDNFKELKNNGIDLIYIDSYHENYHVLKLLNIWFKYLKKNGAIFVDDVESLPFRKKKDPWNSIVYDQTKETVRNFYYNNEDKIFFTMYYGENGLAKLEKLTDFLDEPNKIKKIWNYNYLLKVVYPYLRRLKNYFKKS
ncbi:MAG: hypothetical protein CBE33_06090 [Candidatus Pelagibacter sp. TMED273]|nr:MAG: hypothetical protein CBE33_06090 [Candidatus Pelagibacter sp. TMED273]|tara:strand:+ start:975 stop:1664 length:690 start_codon:yes stop_codon:yes gene_type:complete